MNTFLDFHWESLNKTDEQLCGDKVKVVRGERSSIAVLSDGLGSGVKANILGTLTSEIVVTMLKRDVPLKHVVETVIATLPVCKVRNLAYATFSILQVNHDDLTFRISNFDNPPTMLFREGKLAALDSSVEEIAGKKIRIATGQLQPRDFLALLSDGVLNAGSFYGCDDRWDWDRFARYMESVFLRKPATARHIVHAAISKTDQLYRGRIADDATLLGAFVRNRKSLLVFTGPPLDQSKDDEYAERVLTFDGRKVVCGGTTAQIIENHVGEMVETVPTTATRELPPIGYLTGVDLVTEGILTMARTLDELKGTDAGHVDYPYQRTAASLLAHELTQADSITFLVGQTVNPYYQNPQLPRSVSIRVSLVQQLAQCLRARNKEVSIELC